MNKEFNLSVACNALIQSLQKNSKAGTYRLSLDVLLPVSLRGDQFGMCDSIKRICAFLALHLVPRVIDIELLKKEQYESDLIITFKVRGAYPKSLNRREAEKILSIDKFLGQLPYRTSLLEEKSQLTFLFSMTFTVVKDIFPATHQSVMNKRILIAEDNRMNALVIASFLEDWGCRVTTVTNGEEAVQAVAVELFDIILMDMYMPIMNGKEAIHKIRSSKNATPIIALATSSWEQDIRESLRLGANAFLVKPISSGQLRSIIEMYG